MLVHVEVQAQREASFARRVFVYHYRLYDREEQPVVSLAVLADGCASWRPESYGHALMGCELTLRFPVAKLKDLEGRWAELEASDNPFAVVAMAHLKTQATRGDPEERARWKLALSRALLRRGWSRDDILELYRALDWLMALPPGLQQQHEATLEQEHKEGKMPHLTVWERRGLEKGKEQGLQQAVLAVLEERFGAVPDSLQRVVHAVGDPDRLSRLHRLAIKTPSLQDFEADLDEG